MRAGDQELVSCLARCKIDRKYIRQAPPTSLRNTVPAMISLESTLPYPNSNLYLNATCSASPSTLCKHNLSAFSSPSSLTLLARALSPPSLHCTTVWQHRHHHSADALRLHRQNEISGVVKQVLPTTELGPQVNILSGNV